MNKALPILLFLWSSFILTEFAPAILSPENALCNCSRMGDSLVLVDLYNSTNGSLWTNAWNLSHPLDSFYGVVLNNGECVRALNLENNNLDGTLPSSIGNLSQLLHLRVADNQISGTIPTTIGSLTQLRTLNVLRNNLTGTIPTAIKDLTNLEFLQLGGNNLVGTLPAGIDQLTEIEILNLAGTTLTGGLPTGIGKLTKMRILAISNSTIGGTLPDGFGNLTSLEAAFLSNCGLSGSLPDTFMNLQVLETLYLDSNQVSGSFPASIANCTSLVDLRFQNNQLTGSLPADMGNMQALGIIWGYNNQLTGSIPASIGNCSRLGGIRLQNNQLTGSLPAEIGNLDSLGQLRLNNNNLSGPIPPELAQLTLLVNFLLQDNQLTGSIPTGFGNDTNMVQFQLSNNQLTGPIPPDLGSMTHLKVLNLQNNQLSGGFPAALGHLSNLEELNLFNNRLSGALPTEIGGLASLTQLRLFNNQFEGALPAKIGDLTSLFDLSIHLNNFSGPIPTEIGNLNSLRSFLAYQNNFSGAIPSSIGTLPQLQRLELHNNELSGNITTSLSGLSNLKSLLLHYNDLSGNIPSQLGQLTALETLNIAGNQLSGSLPGQLGNLTSLEFLALGGQFLSGPIPGKWGELSNLEVLNLNGNTLSGEIPDSLGMLSSITNMNLSGNQFTGCIPSSFFGLCSATITLSNNPHLQAGDDFQAFCQTGQGSCLNNYECTDAAFLPMNDDPCGRQFIAVKLDSATTSVPGPTLSCQSTFVGQDAWFQAEVPATKNFLVRSDEITNAALTLEAYVGSCGNLTPIACEEVDSIPFVMAFNGDSLGLNIGQTVYFRAWEQGNTVVNSAEEAIVGLSAHELDVDETNWELCDFPISVLNDTTSFGAGNRQATQFVLQFDAATTPNEVQDLQDSLVGEATLVEECPCVNTPLQLWLTDDPVAMENLRKKGKVSKSKSQVDTTNYNYYLEPRTIIGNTLSQGEQNRSAVGIDGTGKILLGWQDYGRDGSLYGIFARRFNPDGTPDGDDVQINTITGSNQEALDVAVDPAGMQWVVWMSGSTSRSIFGRAYNADGQPLKSETLVSGGNTGFRPAVDLNGSGLGVVAWEGLDSGGFGITAQLIEADGDLTGDPFQVIDANNNQESPGVSLNDAGNLAVVWQSDLTNGSVSDIYGTVYTITDSLTIESVQSNFLVNSTTTGAQQSPVIDQATDGTFVVAWESSGQDGDGFGIYARRFDATGNPLGSEIAVNTTTSDDQQDPAVAVYDDGGFVVTWESFGQDGDAAGIYFQLFDPAGNKVGGEVLVNTETVGSQIDPDIALNSTGNVVISWTSYGGDDFEQGIYAQRFTTAGSGGSRSITPSLDASTASGLGAAIPYATTAYTPTNPTGAVRVGVFDTGIDADHPNLVNSLWTNPEANDSDNCLTGDVTGYDFVNLDGDPNDVDGHGSSVSGMIVNDFPTDIDLDLITMKFYENARGNVFGAVCGIYYAVNEGAKVLNLSWGFEAAQFPEILYDALRYASERDVLIVNSAGNTSKDNDQIDKYPGNLDIANLIVVASSQTDSDGNNPRLADFSSFGPTTVDLAAPGYVETTNFDGTLINQSGTSFSAPIVARTAAVIRAQYPCLTAAQIKDCILSTVDTYDSFTGKTVTGGILDHDAAVACAATKSCLQLSVKVNLQGAYHAPSGKMRSDLSQATLLPRFSPFNATDSSTTSVLHPVTAIAEDNEIVDWVTVQLRNEMDSTLVEAERSALLQRDGDVVDLDGESPVRFYDVPSGNYFVAVRTRNHLGVMTEEAVLIN